MLRKISVCLLHYDQPPERFLYESIVYVISFALISLVVYFFNGLSLNRSAIMAVSDFVTGYSPNIVTHDLKGRSGDVIRHWSLFHQLLSYTVLVSASVSYISYYFVSLSGDLKTIINGNGGGGGPTGGGDKGGGKDGSRMDEFESTKRVLMSLKGQIEMSSKMRRKLGEELDKIKGDIVEELHQIRRLVVERTNEVDLWALDKVLEEVVNDKRVKIKGLHGSSFEGLRQSFDNEEIGRLLAILDDYEEYISIKEEFNFIWNVYKSQRDL